MTEWARSQLPRPIRSRWPAAGTPSEENSPAGEVRPRAPLFFLSYAHAAWQRSQGAHPEPNQRVAEFFDDLSENVAQLVARPPGADPGFMDRGIPGGTRWTPELLEAVGTCQVFVALLSDPYVSSEWCGMEWYAFSQRTVTRRAGDGIGHQTGIIPVIWTPVPETRLPKVVRAVTRFSPRGLADANIPARYETDGVFGLKYTGPDGFYQGVVWRLAQRIAEFHFGHVVQPRVMRERDLRDIFRESQL
jgi:TIR domain